MKPVQAASGAAHGALRSNLTTFVRLAKTEIGQLKRDAVKLRDRGFPRVAADVTEWQHRLERLVELAEYVTREPGVPH